MWKSVIRDYPEEQDESGRDLNPLYLEWVEALKGEPWFVALRDLVKWTGTWTGTEENLMKEVRLRMNREEWEAEDFPSDFQELRHYYEVLYFSLSGLRLHILDYRELTEEDLKEFEAPGWGPESPILVERDWAGRRPEYYSTMFEWVKYEDPLLLAVLIFTQSSKFVRSERRWTGSAAELVGVLKAHFPMPGLNCHPILERLYRTQLGRRADDLTDVFYRHSSRELLNNFDLLGPSGYRQLHARLKTCARILKEVGIKVSQKKVTRKVHDPGGVMSQTKKTRWIVEGPHWIVEEPHWLRSKQ